MLNLAIECSGVTGSVALFKRNEPLDERQPGDNACTARDLAGVVAALLSAHSLRKVDFISVTSGPGSFTGLRAGLATAKMLGLAWKIPIVPVDTLQVIAYRAASSHSDHQASGMGAGPVFLPVINAFRKQVFTAAWQLRSGPAPKSPNAWGAEVCPLALAQVVDAGRWTAAPFDSLELCCRPGKPAHRPDFQHLVITGPGLRTYRPQASLQVTLAPAADWEPRATDVARLGWADFSLGRMVSAVELRPNYVRASAAEDQAKLKS